MRVRILLLGLVFLGGCDRTDATPADAAVPMDAGVRDDDGGARAVGDAGEGADMVPAVSTPQPLIPGTGLYPRVIRLGVGAAAGTIVASVVASQASGHLGGTILASHDDGLSFAVVGHIDTPLAAAGLCCATLYELPRAVGSLAAGTLLWAASIG
ncbi:MAG TPA: hypothetical protein VHB97_07330, partial [Polyangia bacterium]|nr:hypothetical protein [Polyangia bacterium]